MNRQLIAGWCLLVFVISVPSDVVAANKPNNGKNNQEEQKEKEREHKAEQDVKAARAKAEAAQKQLAAAAKVGKESLSARDHAAKRIKEVKDRVEDKHLSRSGMASARDRQAIAKKEYEQALEPVLAAIKADSNYQAAVETAAAAKLEYAAGGVDESRFQELKDQVLRPGVLERAAVEADPKAKVAKQKMFDADKDVASAKEKLDQMVDSDPEVQKAVRELAEANKHLDDAKRKYASELRDATQANAKVNQEIAQLNQIKNANRVDDLKDKQAAQKKNNNNNKNQKGKKK